MENEKLKLIESIFTPVPPEGYGDEVELSTGENHFLRAGNYHGGVYNGRKYMYSDKLIQTLSIEKLESFIKRQIGSL